MAWVYLDDRFPEHPKVQAAGDEAGWLYVCALAYSQRNGTLGRVPKNTVAKLTGFRNPKVIARRLVDAGLWHDEGDHYDIHDYVPWNQSAVKAANMRSEKARRAAEKRWGEHPPSNAQASPEHPPEHHSSNGRASPEHPPSTCVDDARAFPPRASDRLTPNPKPQKQQQGLSDNSARAREAAAAAPSEIEKALVTLAERRLKAHTGPPVENPAGYLRTAVEGIRTDHARRLAALPPDLETCEQIADWLEPKPAGKPRTKPADPLEKTAAAAAANYALNDRPACPTCGCRGGNGTISEVPLTPGGQPDHTRPLDIKPCPTCTHQAPR